MKRFKVNLSPKEMTISEHDVNPVCDISDELLDQIIDRVDAHFKAPTTNVDCDDQRSEVTPL